MRSLLSYALALLALSLGLATSVVQVENHERAARLADMVREIEMLECLVQSLEAECQGYVHPLLRQSSGVEALDAEQRELLLDAGFLEVHE